MDRSKAKRLCEEQTTALDTNKAETLWPIWPPGEQRKRYEAGQITHKSMRQMNRQDRRRMTKLGLPPFAKDKAND